MKSRIQAIIKNHNIDVTQLSDFICAVVTSEKLHGTNKKESDIDRFAAEFPDFGIKPNTLLNPTPLPRVQVMRIFVDSICLYLSRNNIKISGLHLTMPSSVHIGIGRLNAGVSSYSDEAECEKMLKLLEAQKTSNVDVDDLLAQISVLVPSSIKKNITLNSKYAESAEKYGFSVSKTFPENPLIALVDSLVVFMLRTETLYYSMRIDMNAKNIKGKLILAMSNNIYTTYTRNKYLSRALGNIFNITLLPNDLESDTVLTLYKLAFS